MVKDPTFLIINDFSIYWHGLFMMAALGAGMVLSYQLRKKQTGQINKDILITYIMALPLALVGARAYFCWCKPDDFAEKSNIFDFSNGGYGMIGAIVGVSLGIIIAAIVQRVRIGELLDVCAPGMGLAISIGRWSAAFSGENLGGIVSSEGLQWLPIAMYSYDEGLYRKAFFAAGSFITLLITLAVLWLFWQRYIKKTLKNNSGDIFMLFIIVYLVIQGIYEQYRFDPLYFNTPYIVKLQTVSATFSLGALLAALPLAVMIIRGMFAKGFNPGYLVYIPLCGVLYFGYFNIVLRVESVNETLNGVVLVLSAVGLALIAVKLFVDAANFSERSLFGFLNRFGGNLQSGRDNRYHNRYSNDTVYRW